MTYSVVVPTAGRPSLDALLRGLAEGPGPEPARVVVVDDRRAARAPLAICTHGLPVVVNTSLNTAGRPMVDDPRDALECFGSAPVDLLAVGPFVVRRTRSTLAGAES